VLKLEFIESYKDPFDAYLLVDVLSVKHRGRLYPRIYLYICYALCGCPLKLSSPMWVQMHVLLYPYLQFENYQMYTLVTDCRVILYMLHSTSTVGAICFNDLFNCCVCKSSSSQKHISVDFFCYVLYVDTSVIYLFCDLLTPQVHKCTSINNNIYTCTPNFRS
jgi:hypothetical protein